MAPCMILLLSVLILLLRQNEHQLVLANETRRQMCWSSAEPSSSHHRSAFRALVPARWVRLRGGAPKKIEQTGLDQPSLEDLEDWVTSEVLDALLDDILLDTSRGPTVRLDKTWLWRQWDGTVLPQVYQKAIHYMAGTAYLAVLIGLANNALRNDNDGRLVLRFQAAIQTIGTVWKTFVPITSLVLICFLGHAYFFWQNAHSIAKSLEGSIHDITLLLATHTRRRRNRFNKHDAQMVLEEIFSILQLYHILLWAARSRRLRILLTEKGIARLIARGMMTMEQKDATEMPLGLDRTERHYIMLEWIVWKFQEANKKGILQGGGGLEQLFLTKVCDVRDKSSQLASLYSRISLPYLHFVQVLVDFFLLLAPIAQYAEVGPFSFVSAGLIVLVFEGLLELAKNFLDPMNSKGQPNNCAELDGLAWIKFLRSDAHKWRVAAQHVPR